VGHDLQANLNGDAYQGSVVQQSDFLDLHHVDYIDLPMTRHTRGVASCPVIPRKFERGAGMPGMRICTFFSCSLYQDLKLVGIVEVMIVERK
jgi:hypothetical protein